MAGYALSFYLEKGSHQKLGLTPERSYNIMDVKETQKGHEKAQVTSIYIRDPWSADLDHYSTKLLGNVTGKTLEIPVKTFIANIDTVHVAMVGGWKVAQKTFKSSTRHTLKAAFATNATEDVHITFDYPSARMYPEGCPSQ